MENYLVSARKFRPTLFEDVVGQEPVITTLRNALKAKQLAHAFLFAGPRGVGKTTCARILTKAINCQHPTQEMDPCNSCHSCTSFNENSSFNMYELDAASNNSVEDIRNLVEQIRYPPQGGAYKVYIIDEVHMLSQAAFNAFLKTLEEPPQYAIFILATTEKHKVLPTIISRCQVFNFQRISSQTIVNQINYIAAKKNIPCDEKALLLIAEKADGALRDALSMFDMVTNFGGGKVTYQATIENLHVLDTSYYFKLTNNLYAGELASSLLVYNEIIQTGFDGLYFIEGLLEHFRNLLVAKDASTLPLLATTVEQETAYSLQTRSVTETFLVESLEIIKQGALQYKDSLNKRFHIELILMEIAQKGKKRSTLNELDGTDQKAHIPVQNLPSFLPADSKMHTPEIPQLTTTVTAALPNVHATLKASANAVPNTKKTLLPPTIKIPTLATIKASLEKGPPLPIEPLTTSTNSQPKNLDPELVLTHWKNYALELKISNRIPAYTLLQKPFRIAGDTIWLSFTNTIEERILAEIKEELVQNLQHNLNYGPIKIIGQLDNDQLGQARKPYTAQEKFNYFVQKNPSLQLFKEKLTLELTM